jgi:hypothetical protein
VDALPKAKANGEAKKAKAKAEAPKKKAKAAALVPLLPPATPSTTYYKAKAAPKSAPEIGLRANPYAPLARSLPGAAMNDELPYGRKSYTVVAHKKCCCQILLARRAFYVVKPVLPPSLKDSGHTLNAQGDLQIAWSDNIPAAWDTVMSVCTFTDLQK